MTRADHQTVDSPAAAQIQALHDAGHLDADSACRLLDFTRAAILKYWQTADSEKEHEQQTRLRARIQLITKYIQTGGKRAPQLAATHPGRPDLMDTLATAARLNQYANLATIESAISAMIKAELESPNPTNQPTSGTAAEKE
jgi:hypothetical protein